MIDEIFTGQHIAEAETDPLKSELLCETGFERWYIS